MNRIRRAASLISLLLLAAAPTATPTATQARDIGSGLPDLVATLLPSVVNIATLKIIELPRSVDMPADPAITRRVRNLGSGFLIDPGGIIATNRHVIDGATEITVSLQNGNTYRATLLAAAQVADVALLKIAASQPLPTVQFADSDQVRVGDPVVAIGNPLGLGGSVTRGIVSALNRDIRETPFDDFIQTDAAINHGNSGGPLFDDEGRVIGINTAIFGPADLAESGSIGLAFALPANDARFVIDRLRRYGRVRAGSIGIRIQTMTPNLAEAVGLHSVNGALIAGTDPGGPADAAGIEEGDVILQFNDRLIPDIRNLWRNIATSTPGQSVPVMLWRDNRESTIQVKVAEAPEPTPLTAATPNLAIPGLAQPVKYELGLTLEPVDPDLRTKYRLPPDQGGMLITEIANTGAAADLNLSIGDVVVKVNRIAIASQPDLTRLIDSARSEHKKYVMLLIHNENGDRWEALPLGDTQ